MKALRGSFRKILALLLAAVMALGIVAALPAAAAEDTGGVITYFAPLDGAAASRVVAAGTGLPALNLPGSVAAAVTEQIATPSEAGAAERFVPVTWESSPAYDETAPGVYTFRAAVYGDYTLAEGVTPPVITVTVTAAPAALSVKAKAAASTFTLTATPSGADFGAAAAGYDSAALQTGVSVETAPRTMVDTIRPVLEGQDAGEFEVFGDIGSTNIADLYIGLAPKANLPVGDYTAELVFYATKLFPATSTDAEYTQTVSVRVPLSFRVRNAGVYLNKTELSLSPGGGEQLTAEVLSNSNPDKTVLWSKVSGSASIAVEPDGTVRAAADALIGDAAVIRAVSVADNNKYADCKVTVAEIGVSLNDTELSLAAGGNRQLTATVTPPGVPQGVTWKVLDGGSASISVAADGTVRAAADAIIGDAGVIRAISDADDTKYAECEVTVSGYIITFDADGGQIEGNSSTMQTGADGRLTKLPMAAKVGYDFDSWRTSLDGGTKITAKYVFAGNTTVYAHWSKIGTSSSYTITFDSNNNSVTGTVSTQQTGTDGKLSSLPTPERVGYTFDGWYTQIVGGTRITADYAFAGDTTVYAHWSKIGTGSSYTITFDPNNNLVTGTINTQQTGTDGKLSSLPLLALEKFGYTFDGWYTQKSGGTQITTSYVFTEDTTVYAHWTQIGVYTITFNVNYTSPDITDYDTRQTGTDGKLSSLPTPKRDNYSFDGWYTQKSGGTQITTSYLFTGDATVYAHWTQTFSGYIISFLPNKDGVDDYAISMKTGTDGKLKSLPTETRDGYSFDGWYTQKSGGTRITTSYVFTEDTRVYAHWSKNSSGSVYTISFNAGGGSVTPETMQTGADGKLESLPVPTRDGYSFDGWFTEISGGTRITTSYVFTGNTTVYAHWTYTGLPLLVVNGVTIPYTYSDGIVIIELTSELLEELIYGGENDVYIDLTTLGFPDLQGSAVIYGEDVYDWLSDNPDVTITVNDNNGENDISEAIRNPTSSALICMYVEQYRKEIIFTLPVNQFTMDGRDNLSVHLNRDQQVEIFLPLWDFYDETELPFINSINMPGRHTGTVQPVDKVSAG